MKCHRIRVRQLRYEQLERREVLSGLGPMLVKDIHPGESGGLANSYNGVRFAEAGSRVYFQADDGEHGAELWSSDGTEPGTQMVVDALPGADAGGIGSITSASDRVFFVKLTSPGAQLWETDSSDSQLVTAGGMAFTPSGDLVEFGGSLYFTTQTLSSSGLWSATGAAATLVRPDDNANYTFFGPDIDISAAAHGSLYFTAVSGDHGREIWRTNGAGAERVTDLVPGDGSPSVNAMYSDGQTLYFTTTFHNGIWSLNGPDSPAQLLHDFGSSGQAVMHSHRPVTFGDYTYFWATPNGSNRELWRTDGTPAGTTLFFEPGPTSFGFTHDLAAGPDGLNFFASDTDGVYRLWSSTGGAPAAGPPVAAGAQFVGLFDGKLAYFGSSDPGPAMGVFNQVVFIGGETLALPENVFLAPPISPSDVAMAQIGNTLFFAAWSSDSGTELWKWELEPAEPGTQTIQIDIKPGDDTNTLNLTSNGLLTVALFSSSDFDATQAAIGTIIFAGAHIHNWQYIDINGDGRLDLLLNFRIQDTNLSALYAAMLAEDMEDGTLNSTRQQAIVELTGEMQDGTLFDGSDEMNLFLAGKSLRTLLDQLAAAGAI
jgi:ELWxxDGT repeat protein